MTNRTLRIPLHPHFSREKPLLTYPSLLSLRNSLFALDVSHLVVTLQSVQNLSYSWPCRKRSKDGTPWSHCSYSPMLWKAHIKLLQTHMLARCFAWLSIGCHCASELSSNKYASFQATNMQAKRPSRGTERKSRFLPFILNFRVISEAKLCEIWFRLKTLPLYLRQEVCGLNSEP